MAEMRELDVYWTVHKGRRYSVWLSESEAWQSLERLADDDSYDWTVEQTHETVPLSLGEVVEGEGEEIVLSDNGGIETTQLYMAVHVFWDCPLCGNRHNVGLYDNPVMRGNPASNPSIWYCEEGKGIVLVHW